MEWVRSIENNVKPMVSIVMPVYNAANFLKNAIQDILRQTYKNIELICVDDGSTDKSLKMLQYFSELDNRVQVICTEHKGAGEARNTGLDVATGEYLLFLDADDRFELNLIEKVCYVANKNDLDILIYDGSIINAVTGQQLDSMHFVRNELLPKFQVFSYKDCIEDIFTLSDSVVWNKLYRRKHICDNNIRFQNVPYLNDMYFNHISLVTAERIMYLNEKLIHYYRGRYNAVSSKENRNQYPLCVYEVAKEIKSKLLDLELYESVKNAYFRSIFTEMLWTLETMEGDAFIDLYEEIKKLISEWDVTIEKMKGIKYPDWLYDEILLMSNLQPKEFVFYLIGKYKRLYENAINSGSNNTIKHCQKIINQKKWRFDRGLLSKNARIVLYGAGDVGRDFYRQILEYEDVEVVAWVDKNYQNIKGEYKIVNTEKIRELKYDKILMAIYDKRQQENAFEYLTQFVKADRIIIPSFQEKEREGLV